MSLITLPHPTLVQKFEEMLALYNFYSVLFGFSLHKLFINCSIEEVV